LGRGLANALLALEDLHWANPTTLELLRGIAAPPAEFARWPLPNW
jgi:hypothetical protein